MNQVVSSSPIPEAPDSPSIIVHCFMVIQQALVGKATPVRAFECLKSLEAVFADDESLDFFPGGCDGYKPGWYWMSNEGTNIGPYLTKTAAQVDYDFYKALV